MYRYELSIADTVRDADGRLSSANYFYGSQARDDYLLRDPESLPRFGHLARKALMHYAREHYNPHTITVTQEPFMRDLIKGLIDYKIRYKRPCYDWEWIDHFFKKVVSEHYNLGLDVDEARIDKGFAPPYKAPFFDLVTMPV